MNEVSKPLPANVAAERAVLGACLVSEAAIHEALTLLRPEDFSRREHQLIFSSMRLLQAQQIPVELVSLVESLSKTGTLESAGGSAFVSALGDGVPRVTNVVHHANIVRSKAKLRHLIHVTEKIQRQAFDGDDDGQLAEQAVSEILTVAGDGSAQARPRTWKEAAASAMADFSDAFHNPSAAHRIEFGIGDLDDVVGGLRRKELVSLVAPTSNGKTLLAAQCAVHADADGFRVLFVSAEMPAEDVVMREISFEADVPFYVARRPEKATAADLAALQAASQVNHDIRIMDGGGITPARIWATAEAMKRNGGLDLVIADYDQLIIEAGMDPESNDDSIFKHQRAFIFAAKRLAERLDLTFMFLSQLRKLSPAVLRGAQPHLDDVWGDSSVRNTPHLVLWLSREFFTHELDPAFERKAKVHVLKHRSGRTGVVDLEFDPDRLRFSDALPTAADSVPDHGSTSAPEPDPLRRLDFMARAAGDDQ